MLTWNTRSEGDEYYSCYGILDSEGEAEVGSYVTDYSSNYSYDED